MKRGRRRNEGEWEGKERRREERSGREIETD